MNVEYYRELRKPFPKEAMTQDRSRGFALTSIKPQWVKERLNEVFGIAGWEHTGEYREVDGGVLFFGRLEVNYIVVDSDIPVKHRFGHNTVGFAKTGKNPGDTYKSAATDALSKGASNFGIGNDVFKGNVDPETLEIKDDIRMNYYSKATKLVREITEDGKDQEAVEHIADQLGISGNIGEWLKKNANVGVIEKLEIIKKA